MIHPITFSIPNVKLVNELPKKTQIISTLIPGKQTFLYNTEESYYKQYQDSYFATTMKKGGWDCLRHYEILANGCLPYFIDIEKCPTNTLALIPKDLLVECNNLYLKLKDKNIEEISLEENKEYYELLERFFNYTKNNLTTLSLAKYVLEKSGHPFVKKILFISGNTDPDYLRCVTLHGFKELLGKNCHDYPRVTHLYKYSGIHNWHLWGKGFSYTELLDSSVHDHNYDHTLNYDISNKSYDIVIYGSYHRGMPLYDLVSKYYKPNEIILFCGEDEHICDYQQFIDKGHTVFVRELN